MNKLPEVVDEHVMRCQVTGGFIEVRFRHTMTAEDIADLVGYLSVWERHLAKREARVVVEASPPWFDTCQTIDCQAWPTWRVVDAAGRAVRGSYNCDEHRPQEQPLADGERYERRQPLRPSSQQTTETKE